jgi:diphthamide biosynthesis protein 3
LKARYRRGAAPGRETDGEDGAGRRGRRARAVRAPPARDDERAMSGAYDEVDLEDMDWNDELGAYTYQCPCGDFFQITLEELRNGEDVARCPSCSLVLLVIYDPEDLPSEDVGGG